MPGASTAAPGAGGTRLASDGVITDRRFFRGFVEHVAIAAKDFLAVAEALYVLAPIRHVTLTDASAHTAALAASPHLAQLRSIALRSGVLDDHAARRNELTDEQLRMLARSPHLHGLRHLDLGDATALTPRALDHLAMAPGLTSLSAVTAASPARARRGATSSRPATATCPGSTPTSTTARSTPIPRRRSSTRSATPPCAPTSPPVDGPPCRRASSTRSSIA
jgi:hypothetical protein